VKRSESGVIVDPFYLHPHNSVREALALMARYRISGVPIVDKDKKLVGILTNRDLVFEENVDQPIDNVMTKEGLITAPVHTTLEQAKAILHKHRIEKLPLVDENYVLKGLITIKDISKAKQYPNSSRDDKGRLVVAAAGGRGGRFSGAQRCFGGGRRRCAGDRYRPRAFPGRAEGLGKDQGRLWRQSGYRRGQCGHR